MIVRLFIVLIHGYRWFIAPYMTPRCRFEPSCSAYAIHALRYHGLKHGLYLMIRRLLRCHPIKKLGGSWGYDPVPLHHHNHKQSKH
jgi:putative membrane protein insertion efficiency factor